MNKEIQEFLEQKIKIESAAVRQLGEQMGYGHLMALASALWRDQLQKSGTPIEGASIPVLSYDVKDEQMVNYNHELKMYDSWVNHIKINNNKEFE